MPDEQADIEALGRDLESPGVERTTSVNDTDKFCKAICAFANDMPGSGRPGYLLVGVDERGEPSRVEVTEKLLAQFQGYRTNGNIQPVPDLRVYRAPYRGSEIVVVEVRPSDMPPVRFKQTVWIRTGPAADRATPEQERRLEERRIDRAMTWDMRACREATLDDLALDLFTLNYLPKAVSPDVLLENSRSIEDQLGSLRLYHRKLGAPTNAAVLLFGTSPLDFFPGAYVQVVQYDGVDQAAPAIRDLRLAGDLLTVMRGLDALAREAAMARPVRSTELRESVVSAYPEVALHELFINAVIHRNYDGSTTPIHVNHFTDRIEILNPGSLYGDLTREDFPRVTAYRNPVLAEAARTLGFANRFGRGIAVAQSDLQKNQSPPLDWQLGPNHMLMIVRRRP
ncbi:MAG: putative DNA binding domain-containing protein [Phycisphaerales bacterium]|nr:putative DNA binding domain-containing protein [Phycisphaerales bacterium]